MKLFSILPRWSALLAGCTLLATLAGCGGGASDAARSLDCALDRRASSATELKACTADLDGKIGAIMGGFMTRTGVTAATVAIARNRTVLVEGGYGHRDVAKQVALPANALFITASIVKPVTAAAIQTLARNGKLALSDRVFCTGANSPCWLRRELLPASFNARVADITIGQLLEHRGGWDATVSGDPLIAESLIQQVLNLSAPPEQADIIRVVMAQPLDFTPGAKSAYSNFGYMLLGRIVEQASETSYVHYIQEAIMQPLGIAATDFEGMKSLLKDHNPREPNYITSLLAPSVFAPGTTVLATDGAVRAENWVAAGTSITTAKAMALFAASYRIPDGIAIAGATNNGGFTGANPGVATIVRQLPSGISYAVMLNKLDENNPSGDASYQAEIVRQFDAAIEAAGL
jgi:CubicO group peptidase (beta-lactamase class C family)